MAKFAHQEILIRVTKIKARDFKLWTEAISLQSRSGKTIESLAHRVSSDRLGFAIDIIRTAKAHARSSQPQYRLLIGRAYYSMYHAVRALSYYVSGGDDHQEHKDLPQHFPDDFPNRTTWSNSLKNARETRNRADYDPYPKARSAWKKDATDMIAQADNLLTEVKTYLAARGVYPT